jgi:hypothetical protein
MRIYHGAPPFMCQALGGGGGGGGDGSGSSDEEDGEGAAAETVFRREVGRCMLTLSFRR